MPMHGSAADLPALRHTGPAGGDTCTKHDLSTVPINRLNPPADGLLVL